MIHDFRCERERRGVAVVSFVAALLVIGTIVLWTCQITAATNHASMGHYYSTGAIYAGESGMEMALRELNQSPPTDIDSDGTIGTISDNGNAADDPQIATGAFYVKKVGVNPATYRAYGRTLQTAAPYSNFTRTLEIEIQ